MDSYSRGPAKCFTASRKPSDLTVKADDGACSVVSGRSSLRSSLSVPTDWPMQRMVMMPPPAGPTFMIDVMVPGAFGAQACQAANSCAARDCESFHDTPNTRAVFSGKTLSVNPVATPKLPPPPPRHAQYRPG